MQLKNTPASNNKDVFVYNNTPVNTNIQKTEFKTTKVDIELIIPDNENNISQVNLDAHIDGHTKNEDHAHIEDQAQNEDRMSKSN